MRSRFFVVSLALSALVAGACSTFGTPDEPVPTDAGGNDVAVADAPEDAAVPLDSSPDVADGADADVFPSTPLVAVSGAGVPFSIETHEVTVAQYNLFKARQQRPYDFPADRCPGKDTLEPPPICVQQVTFANDDPVTCVDWCDADAYCRFIGRRLCGDVNGGTLDSALVNSPSRDEWYYACRGATGTVYPYGNDAKLTNCVTDNRTHPEPVASFTGCEGGFKGVFDMVGNASEWQDSCSNGNCLARGGSYVYSYASATCADNLARGSTVAYADIGFRCCAK